MTPPLPAESLVYDVVTAALKGLVAEPVLIYPCLPDPSAQLPFCVYSRPRTNFTGRSLTAAEGAEEMAVMLVEVYALKLTGQADVIIAAIKADAPKGLNGATGHGVSGCFVTDCRWGTFALKMPGGSQNVVRGQIYVNVQVEGSS